MFEHDIIMARNSSNYGMQKQIAYTWSQCDLKASKQIEDGSSTFCGVGLCCWSSHFANFFSQLIGTINVQTLHATIGS